MKQSIKYISLLIFFAVMFVSCKKVEIERVNKVLADSIVYNNTNNTYTGYATIVDSDNGSDCQYGLCWSAASSAPTIEMNCVYVGKTEYQGVFSCMLLNLQPNVAYYMRSFVKTGKTITYSNVVSLIPVMNSLRITVDTFFVQNTEQTSVDGSIFGTGSFGVANYGHCWNRFQSPTVNDQKSTYQNLPSTGKTFSTTIGDMYMDNDYLVRSYMVLNDNSVYYSEPKTIRINDVKVQTDTAYFNSPNLVIYGKIINLGPMPIIEHGHCWSTVNAYPTINDHKTKLGAINTIGDYTSTIINTNYGTTYYYRAYAIMDGKVKYGAIKKYQI